MSWDEHAACSGMDTTIFFPSVVKGNAPYDAPRRICRGCEVRDECLEFHMLKESPGFRFGFAGGMTPKERDRLRPIRLCVTCGTRFGSFKGRNTCSEECEKEKLVEKNRRNALTQAA